MAPPQHLLLLPPPPWLATTESIQAAYRDPISSVLKNIDSETRTNGAKGAVLDVALPVPYVYEHLSRPRAALYGATQTLVANVYRLVCVVAAREKINVEDEEGIDVRIILVARPRHDQAPEGVTASSVTADLTGPVIDIPTLARSGRDWQKVYSVESEDGDNLQRQFIRHQDARVKTQRVGGGIVQVLQSDSEAGSDSGPAIHHKAVSVGGTWDHIHIGHKLLLTMFAFMLEAGQDDETVRSLTVGITGDELLVNKKFADILESWEQRKDSVLAFLRAIMDFRPGPNAKIKVTEIRESGPNGHADHVHLSPTLVIKLVKISDPFGPTITDESISALVVSAETRAGGKAVNDRRTERGWPALQILEVDVLDASGFEIPETDNNTFESKLSSTSIRKAISERAKLRAKA